MIYALLSQSVTVAEKNIIKTAIRNQDSATIEQFLYSAANISRAQSGVLIHVMDLPTITLPELYCLYCDKLICPSNGNQPRNKTRTSNTYDWHFKHDLGADGTACFKTRGNIKDQGCYIQLGFEGTTARHRTNCKTIVMGQTYCHLAECNHCITPNLPNTAQVASTV